MCDTPTLKTQSKPIAIKPARVDQYSIIQARFDPIQNSPPSMWKARLNKRLHSSMSEARPGPAQAL